MVAAFRIGLSAVGRGAHDITGKEGLSHLTWASRSALPDNGKLIEHRGKAAPSYFPLPWATEPADSFLISAEEMRKVLSEMEFIAELLEDTSDVHLSRTTANVTPAAPGQLGLAVFVDNIEQKAGNARRSLEEGQVRLDRGVFRAK